MPPIEALRARGLLFVDYIAAKHMVAPALNTIVGGAARSCTKVLALAENRRTDGTFPNIADTAQAIFGEETRRRPVCMNA